MSLRDDILGADDLKRVAVDIPEWSVKLYVREMTAAEGVEFDSWVVNNQNNKTEIAFKYQAMIVMLCSCDANGDRIFTKDDIPALMSKNPHALKLIADAAQSLNKMDNDSIEDEAGNSESGLTVVSSSD